MTQGKKKIRTPDERTAKYGPPRCNMIHHIPPSRAHDDLKPKVVIHIDIIKDLSE